MFPGLLKAVLVHKVDIVVVDEANLLIDRIRLYRLPVDVGDINIS